MYDCEALSSDSDDVLMRIFRAQTYHTGADQFGPLAGGRLSVIGPLVRSTISSRNTICGLDYRIFGYTCARTLSVELNLDQFEYVTLEAFPESFEVLLLPIRQFSGRISNYHPYIPGIILRVIDADHNVFSPRGYFRYKHRHAKFYGDTDEVL